jgi:hypothetical protein
MLLIQYPPTKPSIKKEAGKETIFCFIRKKWVTLTPEEWVRQNFLLYLTEVLHFPPALIAVEKQILIGEVVKRFDIVVFNQETIPFIVVECKEMNEPLTNSVMEQAMRYNAALQAKYLMLTNGSHTIAFERKDHQYVELDTLEGIQ